MIEQIRGILLQRHPTFAVIECGGLGYGVHISARSGEVLPAQGSEVTLLTWLQVREDAMQLYGFTNPQEKELFLKLIEVSGVGPKLAQRILSGVSPSDFLSMIAREDHTALSKIKGIGKKTSEMLVLALKDQALQLAALEGGKATVLLPTAQQEAILALHSLGVKDPAAKNAVEKAANVLGTGADVAKLISESLKHV